MSFFGVPVGVFKDLNNIVEQGILIPQSKLFTYTQSWTRPAAIHENRAWITGIGGGGGGIGASAGGVHCGGQSGEFVQMLPKQLTSGSYTVTIGAGGTGHATAPSNGGTSSFGTLELSGGKAGDISTKGAAATGAQGGRCKYTGGTMEWLESADCPGGNFGGMGGRGRGGGAGGLILNFTAVTADAGDDARGGRGYGAGGGGSSNGVAGGDGADGAFLLFWYEIAESTL